jgi:hypothetical protein
MTSLPYKHPHEIAARLQREVDFILHNVDDKTMYAEFREEEIIDIQDGITQQVMKESLDERILFNMNRRGQHPPLVHTGVRKSKTLYDKVMNMFQLLFKPFHV